MKKILFFIAAILFITACNSEAPKQGIQREVKEIKIIGDPINYSWTDTFPKLKSIIYEYTKDSTDTLGCLDFTLDMIKIQRKVSIYAKSDVEYCMEVKDRIEEYLYERDMDLVRTMFTKK